MKAFEKKKTNKIVDEVHKERNGTENANDSQMMTILSTILENGKKRDENLVAWVTNMENEFQESQYDNDFECFDDDQTYDENSNVQYVKIMLKIQIIRLWKENKLIRYRNCSGKPESVFKYELKI